MSETKTVPVEPSNQKLADRLSALATAVTKRDWSEFTMRIPADPKRDADLVLSEAARRLRAIEAAPAPDDEKDKRIDALESSLAASCDDMRSEFLGQCPAALNLQAKLDAIECDHDEDDLVKRIAELEAGLIRAVTAIESLDIDALGVAAETHDRPAYPIRDELLHNLFPLIKAALEAKRS